MGIVLTPLVSELGTLIVGYRCRYVETNEPLTKTNGKLMKISEHLGNSYRVRNMGTIRKHVRMIKLTKNKT